MDDGWILCFETTLRVTVRKIMKTWYFTFCSDDRIHGGYCQPIRASSFGAARAKMVEMHGVRWAFQYSEEEWLKNKNDPHRWYPMERELELVVVEEENERN